MVEGDLSRDTVNCWSTLAANCHNWQVIFFSTEITFSTGIIITLVSELVDALWSAPRRLGRGCGGPLLPKILDTLNKELLLEPQILPSLLFW